MKFEKDNAPNISNIPESDDENTTNWTDLVDRTYSLLDRTEPPPLEDVPCHESVDLTIDTDHEISKPDNIQPERVENELEKSDEICDTQSTASVLGENDADTDVPEEVFFTIFLNKFFTSFTSFLNFLYIL